MTYRLASDSKQSPGNGSNAFLCWRARMSMEELQRVLEEIGIDLSEISYLKEIRTGDYILFFKDSVEGLKLIEYNRKMGSKSSFIPLRSKSGMKMIKGTNKR